MVSSSSHKTQQIWGPPFCRALQKERNIPNNVTILPRTVLTSFMDGPDEEEGDKNKRPRMVLSEALHFPRLDQGGEGMCLGCMVYLFLGQLEVCCQRY